jgi:tetratricopeptide (TPR) repeat protein
VPGNKHVQAQALTAAGFLWMMSGEYRRATALLEQSLAIYRQNEIVHSNAIAYPLLYLAVCATVSGNNTGSEQYAIESLARFRASGDQYGISECLLAQGNNERDPGRAKSLFLEALEIKRRLNDTNGLAYTLQTLCEITVHEIDFVQTQTGLDECLAIYQKVGNRKAVINCQYSQAWIAMAAGEYSVALQRADKAISISREIEEKYLMAKNLLLRCDICLAQADIEAARRNIDAAEKMGIDLNDPTITAAALTKKGRLALILGQVESALPLLQEALSFSREEDDKSIAGFSLYYLGRVALARKDFEAAQTYFEESRQSFYEMNIWSWDYMAYSIEGQAHIALLEGKQPEAARLFTESQKLFPGLFNTLAPVERKEWLEIQERVKPGNKL